MRGTPTPAPKGLENATNMLGAMAMDDIKAIEPIIEEMITEALNSRFTTALDILDGKEGEVLGAHSVLIDIIPDEHELIVRFAIADKPQIIHAIHVERQYALDFASFLIKKARS
jgi:hypothetical protein